MTPSSATEPDSVEIARLTVVHNEKCKAAAAFLYNLSAATVITGVITNIIQQKPVLAPILFLLTATFATIFFMVGSNSLNQMKG